MRRQVVCRVDGEPIHVKADAQNRIPVRELRIAANLPVDRPLVITTREGQAIVLNPNDYVEPNDEIMTTPRGIRG